MSHSKQILPFAFNNFRKILLVTPYAWLDSRPIDLYISFNSSVTFGFWVESAASLSLCMVAIAATAIRVLLYLKLLQVSFLIYCATKLLDANNAHSSISSQKKVNFSKLLL